MLDSRYRIAFLLATAILAGCGAPMDEEPTASVTSALNSCNETVPENRFVDGFPAYSQCPDVSSGSIWSNNGIDTSTTSGGSDWILTQRGGGYQCTEWAFRYMYFRWNVQYRSGNAKEWCDGRLPENLVKTTVPVRGDLIVFDGGVCGADQTTGHIAVVADVNAAMQTVTIVEQNRAGRRSVKQECAHCFLHATANDGSTSAGGIGGAPGTGAAGMNNNMGGATSTGGRPTTEGGMNSGVAGAQGGSRDMPIAGAAGAAGSSGASPTDPIGSSGSGGAFGGAGTGGSMLSAGIGGTPMNTAGASPGSGGALAGASGAMATSGAEGVAAGMPGTPDFSSTNEPGGCSVSHPAQAPRPAGLLASAGVLLGLLVRRRRRSLPNS